MRYSIFAWTTPAVIVLMSATLDKTNTFIIGYGEFEINRNMTRWDILMNTKQEPLPSDKIEKHIVETFKLKW